jgi:hypothetical protein
MKDKTSVIYSLIMAIISVTLSATFASALDLSLFENGDISTPNLKPSAEQNAPPSCRYPPCEKKKK